MICKKCSKEIPDDAKLCCYCGKKYVIERKHSRRGNHEGSIYKRGKTWVVKLSMGYPENNAPDFDNPEAGQKKRREPIRKAVGGFKSWTEASQYLDTYSKKDETVEVPTLKAVYDEWEPWYEPRVGKSCMAGYRSNFKRFSSLNDRPINEITPADLQKCMDDCSKGKRSHQLMKVVAGLVFKYALDHKYVERNISENLYTGKGKSKKREALSEKEVEVFRQAIGKEQYADYIYALCYLGYRPGEFLELKKDQLKKEGEILYLVEGFKTDAGRDRIVPIHAKILDIIKERSEVEGTDLLFPMYVRDRKGNFKGYKQMSDNYFRESVFKPMASRLGIPAGRVPYSARHTFSNKLKKAEGDNIDKAALMGHSNYTFTQTNYQSTDFDELNTIVNSMQ